MKKDSRKRVEDALRSTGGWTSTKRISDLAGLTMAATSSQLWNLHNAGKVERKPASKTAGNRWKSRSFYRWKE